ncbi:hypothetical protein EON77_17705, partial [bacterium]
MRVAADATKKTLANIAKQAAAAAVQAAKQQVKPVVEAAKATGDLASQALAVTERLAESPFDAARREQLERESTPTPDAFEDAFQDALETSAVLLDSAYLNGHPQSRDMLAGILHENDATDAENERLTQIVESYWQYLDTSVIDTTRTALAKAGYVVDRNGEVRHDPAVAKRDGDESQDSSFARASTLRWIAHHSAKKGDYNLASRPYGRDESRLLATIPRDLAKIYLEAKNLQAETTFGALSDAVKNEVAKTLPSGDALIGHHGDVQKALLFAVASRMLGRPHAFGWTVEDTKALALEKRAWGVTAPPHKLKFPTKGDAKVNAAVARGGIV